LEQALNNRRKSIANDDDEENNDVWNTNDEYKTNSLSLPIAEPVDILEAQNVENMKTVENRENQNKLRDMQNEYNVLYDEIQANKLGIVKETQRSIRSQKKWNEKIAELMAIKNEPTVIIKKKKKP
jgi:hypothetical protein